MEKRDDLNIFFNPKAVAVIGATERPGAWGSTVMQNLLSLKYGGDIYPVNVHAERIFNVPAFKEVREIPGPVDLAILTIPAKSIESAVRACGRKRVKGMIIVTSGFSETSEQGLEREKALVKLAHAHGIRVVGPNVSGIFNLHNHFFARGGRTSDLLATSLAAITQGGIAFTDTLTSGGNRGMGVGKFVHTGNECDLTMTDFLDHFGQDPDVKAILLYIEGIRHSRRFIDVARKVTRKKPVVAYKGGRTPGSARAAQSHTAALAGKKELWEALIRQVGIVPSPTMELLLPLGHALVERPPMRGKRIGIITVGGSWGVILSDFLEEAGLSVPEFSHSLQKRLHELGMPERASTRNPIDIGAAGIFASGDMVLTLGKEVLASGETDALILHGFGRPEMLKEDSPPVQRTFLDLEKRFIRGFNAFEKEWQRPVLIGSHFSPWESQTIFDVNKESIRIYHDIDKIARLLSLMYQYWNSRAG